MFYRLFTGVSALALASLFTTAAVQAQDVGQSQAAATEITVTAGRGTALKALDVSTTTIDSVQVQQSPET